MGVATTRSSASASARAVLKPFKVQRKKPSKSLEAKKKGDRLRGSLGCFATAEEAALAVARVLQHS